MRHGNLIQNFQRAVDLHDAGRLVEAEPLYQMVLLEDDRHFDCLCRFGTLRMQQLRFDDAEILIRRAVKIDKRSPEAHQLLGSALSGLEQHEEAVRSYEKAITLRRTFPEAYNNLGYALQVLGRIEEAIPRYKKAVSIRPDYAEAQNNLGNAYHLLGQSENAIAYYEKALGIRPDYAEAYWNLGTALRALGRFNDAVDAYTKAIAIRPNYHEAYNSLGNVFCDMDRAEKALVHYEKAFQIRPDYLQARTNFGAALVSLDRDEAALAVYNAVLAIKPDDADALIARGAIFSRQHCDAEALADFQAALSSDATNDIAFDGFARSALAGCNWEKAAPLWEAVPAHVSQSRYFDAFTFLGYSSDAALQLACAKRYVRHHIPVRPPQLWTGASWRNEKIRIAYVSCGFHKHPTAYLIAELLERHDRSRFEIIGVSMGPDDQSEIRARLIRAFDQFHDVRDKSDNEAAALLHDLRVDIAVDRSGYTTNARPGIFAARPAPIQVNYIGFPGTLGANFYDYILTDATVLPFDQQSFYTERIVHLPNCYLSNDTRKPTAAIIPTRAEAGLPAEGFVFCCFNNSYKATPELFDIWMRLLRQVEGSVLWLFRDREVAEGNLRKEASARGVDPARLIFARRVPLASHLARHRHADLFLDTLPYNAHTTAADALWMGVPVVTCLGKSFAGRVAASLVRAIGAPDLVTDNLEAYEKLALHLASNPADLADLKARIERNRLTHPLFDTDLYRRHIEAGYLGMWERWQRGEKPASFAVQPASAP